MRPVATAVLALSLLLSVPAAAGAIPTLPAVPEPLPGNPVERLAEVPIEAPVSGECFDRSGTRKRRVDPTAAHLDHLHIGLSVAGAAGRTSFWQG